MLAGRARFLIPVLVAGAVAAVLAVARLPLLPAFGKDQAGYIGASRCEQCHFDYHDAWSEGPHGKAFDSLTPEQVASGKDHEGRACVSCHVTGYGKGGFTSAEKTPGLKHVGCEACHGPGSLHYEVMLASMASEAYPRELKISRDVDCVRCHDPHVSYRKKYGK